MVSLSMLCSDTQKHLRAKERRDTATAFTFAPLEIELPHSKGKGIKGSSPYRQFAGRSTFIEALGSPTASGPRESQKVTQRAIGEPSVNTEA